MRNRNPALTWRGRRLIDGGTDEHSKKRKKNEKKALYFKLYWDGWVSDGLRVWWVHWVRERCVRRIGDGRAEYKHEVLLGR